MKKFSIFFISLFLIASFAGHACAQVGTHWQRQFPNMHAYNGMTTVAGLVIAVGDYGDISTSPDGVNWTARNSGSDTTLYDVAGTTGKYVAVGFFGEILYSRNGTDWFNISKSVSSSIHVTAALNGITWGNGEFIAVGDSGTILSSPDGLNWTVRLTLTPNTTFKSVSWNGTAYVAIGTNSSFASEVYTSIDGINWVLQTTPIANGLNDVVSDGTGFVAVGMSGTIATSPDGVTWTNQTSGTGQELLSIIWAGGQYTVAGWFGTVLSSTTGTAWTLETTPITDPFYSLASIGTLRLAGTFSGALLSSNNGAAWSGAASSYFGQCNNLVWDQVSNYVATCGGNSVYVTSTDTYTWAKNQPAGFGGVDTITWDGAQFVSAGGPSLYTSPNGTTGWAKITPGAPFSLIYDMIWDGAQYIAVGLDEKIITSTNLTTWTQQNYLLSGAWLHGIVQGGGTYLAYNSSGAMLTSLDGATWTPSSGTNTYNGLSEITWDGTRYIASGGNQGGVPYNSIITSPDGNTWTPQTTNLPDIATTAMINKIIYNGTQYLAVGNIGTVFTSPDAITWTEQTSGTSMSLLDVLWNGTSYIATGDRETILVSRNNGANPVLTLNGANPDTAPIGVAYTDPGATATDVEDGNLTASILANGTVDIYTLGTYYIDYGVADANGNVVTALRTVIVADTTPPVVTAPPAVTVEATGPTTIVTLDPGAVATAVDNIDGILNPSPDLTSFAVGVHTVTWSATDNAGNTGTATQTVTVTDTTPPTVTIIGGDLTLPQGSPSLLIFVGVTASDLVDGSLTSSIVQTGAVNMNVPGTYTATFTATDSSGNKGSASRKVTIIGTGGGTPLPGSPPAAGGGGGCMIQADTAFDPLLVGLLLLAGVVLVRKRGK